MIRSRALALAVVLLVLGSGACATRGSVEILMIRHAHAPRPRTHEEVKKTALAAAPSLLVALPDDADGRVQLALRNRRQARITLASSEGGRLFRIALAPAVEDLGDDPQLSDDLDRAAALVARALEQND